MVETRSRPIKKYIEITEEGYGNSTSVQKPKVQKHSVQKKSEFALSLDQLNYNQPID